MKKIGFSAWLYIVGFFGAVVLGLLEGLGVDAVVNAVWIAWLLVLVGILIGLFNITTSETHDVLLASLVLGAASGILTLLPTIGGTLDAVMSKIAFLSLAVAVPPAIRILWKNLS